MKILYACAGALAILASAVAAAGASLDTQRPDTAPSQFTNAIEKFVLCVNAGRYSDALSVVQKASAGEQREGVSLEFQRASDAATALLARRQAMRDHVASFAGKQLALETVRGVRKGVVAEANEREIVLLAAFKIDGRVAGHARVKIGWTDLSEKQEEQLAGQWRAPDGTQEIVAGLLALARSKREAARRSFAQARAGAFIVELDVLAGGVRPAPPEPPMAIARREADGHGGEGAGGSGRPAAGVDGAVDSALAWLIRHQREDGRWDGERSFEGRDGGEDTDPAITGLAVLALLGGERNRGPNARACSDAAGKGVAWLASQQDARGCIGVGFGGVSGVGYHHAIAGLALVEATGQGHANARNAAQRAIYYSIKVHQAPFSGWRYDPGSPADMSVTVWFLMQISAGIRAGLDVDGKGFQGTMGFLDQCTQKGGTTAGLVSYQPERSPTPTMTAAGMVCRQRMGWKLTDAELTDAADYLMQSKPSWGQTANVYYWHLASVALSRMDDERRDRWERALVEALVPHQRTGSPEVHGSWDMVGMWSARGGRTYMTAMCCLALETVWAPHDQGR